MPKNKLAGKRITMYNHRMAKNTVLVIRMSIEEKEAIRKQSLRENFSSAGAFLRKLGLDRVEQEASKKDRQ